MQASQKGREHGWLGLRSAARGAAATRVVAGWREAMRPSSETGSRYRVDRRGWRCKDVDVGLTLDAA